MTFELPYPPTTNNAYTIARNRKIKTAVARQYAERVWHIVRAERVRMEFQDVRLRVSITMFAPDARRRDLGNIEKLAVDAVFAALGLDDSQVDEMLLTRAVVDRKRPRLEFTVEEREGDGERA